MNVSVSLKNVGLEHLNDGKTPKIGVLFHFINQHQIQRVFACHYGIYEALYTLEMLTEP